MDYKARISKYQNERNWSTHHMAVEAGLNTSTVSNWFTRNSTPTTDAIEKLCVAFGITMSEFINEKRESHILTEEQTALLEQWNCLHKNEKEDLLKFIKTLNTNRNFTCECGTRH